MSKILVIGDVMLDRYLHGEVTRISQEAPVPIVNMTREECRAGAAANVAMNVKALGADVTLVGIVGKDESSAILRDIIDKAGIRSFITPSDSIVTTQKLRVIGRNQQIVRVDMEQQYENDFAQIVIDLGCIETHDIIVLSDYAKGALSGIQKIIEHAKDAGKTVLVDPKGNSWEKYSRADLVKPNIHEMRDMVGGWHLELELSIKANNLRQDAGIGAILLTRAADGMTLYANPTAHHIHAKAKAIYDVTGAGDTVMAALAVMLSQGKSLIEAATIANYAAGIVVGKFGTATVTMQEIEEAMK